MREDIWLSNWYFVGDLSFKGDCLQQNGNMIVSDFLNLGRSVKCRDELSLYGRVLGSVNCGPNRTFFGHVLDMKRKNGAAVVYTTQGIFRFNLPGMSLENRTILADWNVTTLRNDEAEVEAEVWLEIAIDGYRREKRALGPGRRVYLRGAAMCDKRFPCGTQIITSDIEKIDRTAEKELTAITTGGSTYILPINNCIDVRAEYCG